MMLLSHMATVGNGAYIESAFRYLTEYGCQQGAIWEAEKPSPADWHAVKAMVYSHRNGFCLRRTHVLSALRS